MMSLGLSITSDVIAIDQNWHHLCSTSAGEKDISNDTQIRVISSMEPKICTRMLKMSSENLEQNFVPQYVAFPGLGSNFSTC